LMLHQKTRSSSSFMLLSSSFCVIVVVLIGVIIIVEITPHSARNASDQGWLLCQKTRSSSLFMSLSSLLWLSLLTWFAVIFVVLIVVIIMVEITPYSSRSASEHGWLLHKKRCPATSPPRLVHHCLSRHAASILLRPPFMSHHSSPISPRLSCRALPLVLEVD